MTDYMARLPSDAIKHISGFLDYNSRVDFNTVVTPECRLVKKINSDAHNLHVKVAFVRGKLFEINNNYNQQEYALLIIKLYGYLINTKDTVLFELRGMFYRNAIINRTKEIQEECNSYEYLTEKTFINVMRVTTRLQKKLEDIPFRKKVEPCLVNIL